MRYVRRRRLRGLALKRLNVVLREDVYNALLDMKGTLGNSAAIETLILKNKARMERVRQKNT
ncbi:MAG: hypothetical protein M3O02_11165 [Acidobacteriota bacterium]|nr:hypothetical protein [Acidobacteriota bacterium]